MTKETLSSFWCGRKVLITGHTGFKGSWLALWLNHLGSHVTGLALEPEASHNLFDELGLSSLIQSHNIINLLDRQRMKDVIDTCQPEIVFHLAAQPLVDRSYREPLETWNVNVLGSVTLLECLKSLKSRCAVIMVTTDKVYENRECDFGYRESDRLGGSDPYSASKAAAELAISSWRRSYCGKLSHQTDLLLIASARSGNVIGGGDWAENRIVPDAIRALSQSKPIYIRNPLSTRPWQHVIEPLYGYMRLAEELFLPSGADHLEEELCSPFNFGPQLGSTKTVKDLIDEILLHWPGEWLHTPRVGSFHEATKLRLQTDKANVLLGWRQQWSFSKTVKRTVTWYRKVSDGGNALEACITDISDYQKTLAGITNA